MSIEVAPHRLKPIMGIILVPAAFAGLVLMIRMIGFQGDLRLVRELLFFAFGIALLIYITRGERRSLASIGLLRPTWGTLGWSLAATAVLMLVTAGTYALLMMSGLPTPGGDGGSGNPLWLVAIVAIRAAFVEELVFRGYVLERIEAIGLGSVVAVLLSAALFVLAHLSFRVETMLFILPAALFFGALYVWKRDLIVCMTAHAVVDFVGLAAAALQSR